MASNDEAGCFTLEEAPPELLYAIRRRPSRKQLEMCRLATDLHNRVSDIPIQTANNRRTAITQQEKEEILHSIVRAFAAGGVSTPAYPEIAIDQITKIQLRLFHKYFSPQLLRRKIHFIMYFLVIGLSGIIISSFINRYFPEYTTIANYIYLMIGAAGGVTIIALGTGIHHDFGMFDEDMLALQTPFQRIFLASGVALVLALMLSTNAVMLKIGDMKTTDIATNVTVSLTLGALFGIASVEALKLLARFAAQAINKLGAGKGSDG